MINRKTVFILGAGASKTYGYPLGWELRRLLLRPDFGVPDYVSHGYETDVFQHRLEKFQTAFHKSQTPSIDAFLQDHHEEWLAFGKELIAAVLLPHEHRAQQELHPERDWLNLLWQSLKRPRGEFSNNPVGFIVYNYDRHLEYFLTRTVEGAHHRVSTREAFDQVSKIPIIHPHGQLGEFLPITKDGLPLTRNGTALPYGLAGKSLRVPYMQNAINEISLYWEPTEQGKKRKEAMAALLASAERVVFLGFGFHPSNLDPLWPMILEGQSEVWATCKSMSPVEKNRLLAKTGGTRHIKMIDGDCYELLCTLDIES